MIVDVDDSLLVARPFPNGWTFTLASKLGQMLDQAQQFFGPRDPHYTPVGVEFNDIAYPQTWYPGGRNIAVQLTLSAMKSPNQAYFQLAHECVHMLDPRPGGTNVLEEGIASWFAMKVSGRVTCDNPLYDAAARLASDLMHMEPAAVKNLRAQGFRVGAITAEMLRRECPALPQIYLDNLPSTFAPWVPPAPPQSAPASRVTTTGVAACPAVGNVPQSISGDRPADAGSAAPKEE
jgi:hypothetical protein